MTARSPWSSSTRSGSSNCFPRPRVRTTPTPPPTATRIYVGAQFGNAISVIDPATQSVLHTIPTTAGVRPLEPSEDGKTIYVALSKLRWRLRGCQAQQDTSATTIPCRLSESLFRNGRGPVVSIRL